MVKYWMQQITAGAATGLLPVLLIGRLDGNTINGGAYVSDCQRRRRGSSEGKERGELKINLSIPNPNHQCTSCALLCLILFWRGVWLQSCFVDWMQTDEQVSGKAGAKY